MATYTVTDANHGTCVAVGTKPFHRVQDEQNGGVWYLKDSTGARVDLTIDGPSKTGSPLAPSVFADTAASVAQLDSIITELNAATGV